MHLLDQLKTHKIRTLKTVIACLGHGCIGLQGGIIGPALMDLKILVGCNFDQISHMVTGRFAGYAVGSVIAGLIAPKTNPQLVLGLTLLISALFHVVMPMTYSLSVILSYITITGVANGITDATSNMFLIKLWAKECPPFLQALHFMFGLGSLIAPVIVEPFLKESEVDEDIVLNGTSMSENHRIVIKPEDIQLKYPYFLVAGFTLLISFLYISCFVKYRETTDHPSRTEPELNDGEKKENQMIKIMNPKVYILVIAVTCCFTFIYIGLETSIGTFIPAYSVKGPLQVSKKTGALMSSAFWLAFTCFRLVAVVLSSLIGSTWILILNLSNSIIGSVLILISQDNVPLFWFACIYMGVGLSSTWGSLFGFMESHFAITAPVVTCFMVGSCVGCSVIPALAGHFVDIDTSIFIYITLGFSILVAIIFLAIFVMCKFWLFRYEARKQETFEKATKLVMTWDNLKN